MASNSGWTTGLPSGTSKVSNTDEEFRSLKSFVEAWIGQEHYTTDGSATSAGIAKHGAGRAFVGTASQLSNPTADNDGRLFFVTDDNVLRIGNLSTSSWSVVADNVTLSSNNSWTGLNDYSGGLETSDLSLVGVFSGWTSYSTFTDLASIAGNSLLQFSATDGVASNVTIGDFIVAHRSGSDVDSSILHAQAAAGGISFVMINTLTGADDPSAQTYTAFIYKEGHLQ